jgi:UDP-glucuronate 4-epimerase
MEGFFAGYRPDRVVHLAAQAGVRHSLTHPHVYVTSNIVGFLHLLEGCRHHRVDHLVFASSSSVYGANTRMPFSEHDPVDHPLSLYGATKKANELMGHSYASLYGLPCTGLRIFSVYGPWGRPDMAMFKFTRAILEGRPIDVFNRGQHKRDFTYVDDIAEGIVRILDRGPKGDPNWSGDAPDPARSFAPYCLYNIGNGRPVELMYVIELIENELGCKAIKNMVDIQPGDVPETFASVQDLTFDVGFCPRTSIEEGINRFVSWYREFYCL